MSRSHLERVLATLMVGLCLSATAPGRAPAVPAPADALRAPVVEGRWIRPAAEGPARPVWGHAGGLRVGLWPTPGPRGLLRLLAPHVGTPDRHAINFIAVEPIVTRRRGFSELEASGLDQTRGKRMWSADDASDALPRDPRYPARGVVGRADGVETLTVCVFVEPFTNGARPYLTMTFRGDRPEEVGLTAFAQPGSAPMKTCILTATMGNYARLRRLHLAKRIVEAGTLWPNVTGNGFAPHARFPLAELCRLPDGSAIVCVTPDEANPAAANYAPGTPPWWRYRGGVATQYWRAPDPGPGLVAQANGRVTYWACHVPIPGGVAFENVELVAPFKAGRTLWFGITRRRPGEILPGR